MKAIITISIVFIGLLLGCNSTKSVKSSNEIIPTNKQKDTIHIVNEELEYDIIILDIGFDSWLVTQKPMSYYSNEPLRYKNQLYVIEWNQRVLQPFNYSSDLYGQLIDFNPNIDYGIDVNYMLYQYFQFFQQKYRQRL